MSLPRDARNDAEEAVRRARDVLLPQDSCVNCSSRQAEERSLWAICTREQRRWQSRGGGIVWGLLGGIPFLFPTPSEETVEIREGEDLVVPVPLCVCDDCWRELDGGPTARVLSFISQGLLFGGVLMIAAWIVSRLVGAGLSFLYAVACFAAAIPFSVGSEIIQSQWPARVRVYLDEIPEYAALLAAYPSAEIVTMEPPEPTS